MIENAIDLLIGDTIKIGEKHYYIECNEMLEMPGNEDGLFLQEIIEDEEDEEGITMKHDKNDKSHKGKISTCMWCMLEEAQDDS